MVQFKKLDVCIEHLHQDVQYVCLIFGKSFKLYQLPYVLQTVIRTV